MDMRQILPHFRDDAVLGSAHEFDFQDRDALARLTGRDHDVLAFRADPAPRRRPHRLQRAAGAPRRGRGAGPRHRSDKRRQHCRVLAVDGRRRTLSRHRPAHRRRAGADSKGRCALRSKDREQPTDVVVEHPDLVRAVHPAHRVLDLLHEEDGRGHQPEHGQESRRHPPGSRGRTRGHPRGSRGLSAPGAARPRHRAAAGLRPHRRSERLRQDTPRRSVGGEPEASMPLVRRLILHRHVHGHGCRADPGPHGARQEGKGGVRGDRRPRRSVPLADRGKPCRAR